MPLNFIINQNILTILIDGDFISYNNDKEINDLLNIVKTNKNIKRIIINTDKLLKWDSSLVVILYNIEKLSKDNNIDFDKTTLPDGLQRLLKLAFSSTRKLDISHNNEKMSFFEKVGDSVLNKYYSFNQGFSFLLKSLYSLYKFITGQAIMRKVDFLFAFENASYKALPIVSLISFMVGLILAFVGMMQLKMFGAQIYVASLVAIGMIRIMGPVMTGIIMAGRTGAAYSATIGTMQVNEEINALKTMGIPIIDFLVLPRLLSITIIIPFLSMFADIMGILGGAFVGVMILDLPLEEYFRLSIEIITLKNFLIGIFHGYIYGWVIALCGCYYGIYCGKDANSVGLATTKAVVASIVWIVITTGIITFFCEVWNI